MTRRTRIRIPRHKRQIGKARISEIRDEEMGDAQMTTQIEVTKWGAQQ